MARKTKMQDKGESPIRTCNLCGLVEHSCHDWLAGGPRGEHWKEYYTEANPDVRLTVMPECATVDADCRDCAS